MSDQRLEMSPEKMIEALNNEVRLRDIEINRLRTALKYYAGFTAPNGKVYPPIEDRGLLARTTLEVK